MRTRAQRRQLNRKHRVKRIEVRKVQEQHEKKAEHDNPVRDERIDWDTYEWADISEGEWHEN